MKYTPLKINALGALLTNSGFNINTDAASYIGTSNSLNNYTKGTLVLNTTLSMLSDAISIAYSKSIDTGLYNNLISIGRFTIPALGNSKPVTYTNTYDGNLARYGWLRLFAYQAHNEFYINNGSYNDFLNSLSICYSYQNQMNDTIIAASNSINYLDGVYSNMNDLITSDITGISLSTFYWGQDLIASGRVIDLTMIDTYGEPANLLRVLYKNQALTKSVNLALLAAGLSNTDLMNIVQGQQPTIDQQRLIYSAFFLIVGTDLNDVLTILNCQTKGLDNLADLLYVKKLFPNSYTSLTYPKFNTILLPTNSKTYYPIFVNSQPSGVPSDTIGYRLINMVPPEIAFTADAFTMAMMQIKNIQNMNIEKFSQVVTNLENVTDLNNVSGTTKPTYTQLANNVLNNLGNGSNTDGSYNMCDFFGCMTNLQYDYGTLQKLITSLQTNTLSNLYNQMYNILQSNDYSMLQILIDQANAEILNIKNNNPTVAQQLNDLYEQFGTYLTIEQNARDMAIPDITNLTSTQTNTVMFIQTLDNFALQTEIKGMAAVIENISDLSTVGGNNIVAAMREARNTKRLGLTGLEQDNDVNGTSNVPLPRPTGVTTNNVPIQGFTNCTHVGNVPIITGAPTTPGSLGGSQETMLVPDNLLVVIQPNCSSLLTPDEALNVVTLCNCDCWENL